MSAIFFHDEEQQKLALISKTAEEKRRNRKIQTLILPFAKFYLAEDYHQKYQLRKHQDLTISGARSRNFMPSPLYDGLSAVESAVHQMTEAGVRVVRRVQWKKN